MRIGVAKRVIQHVLSLAMPSYSRSTSAVDLSRLPYSCISRSYCPALGICYYPLSNYSGDIWYRNTPTWGKQIHTRQSLTARHHHHTQRPQDPMSKFETLRGNKSQPPVDRMASQYGPFPPHYRRILSVGVDGNISPRREPGSTALRCLDTYRLGPQGSRGPRNCSAQRAYRQGPEACHSWGGARLEQLLSE